MSLLVENESSLPSRHSRLSTLQPDIEWSGSRLGTIARLEEVYDMS